MPEKKCVTLHYPRVEGHADRIIIELEDVRGADDLEVSRASRRPVDLGHERARRHGP